MGGLVTWQWLLVAAAIPAVTLSGQKAVYWWQDRKWAKKMNAYFEYQARLNLEAQRGNYIQALRPPDSWWRI